MPSLNDLIGILRGNPAIQSNPMAQGMVDVIESGDASKGEQMAKNLCESMGVSREEAVRQAKQFFHLG